MQIQTHLETINNLIEEGTQRIVEEVIISDNPPIYEEPPEYEEIIKITRRKESRRAQSMNSNGSRKTHR